MDGEINGNDASIEISMFAETGSGHMDGWVDGSEERERTKDRRKSM